MKTVVSSLIVILLALSLSSCQGAAQPEATQVADSMKGYELYSWQEGDQWHFSLLVGTNREKSLDEIKSKDNILPDLDTLLSTLKKVPSGQYVTWASRETLSFPPDSIIKQVEEVCKDQGLILNVAKYVRAVLAFS